MSIVNEILQRNEEHEETDRALFQTKVKRTPAQWWRDFKKYHGLSRADVEFFYTSRKLVALAKQESSVIMGRYAENILTRNHIPTFSEIMFLNRNYILCPIPQNKEENLEMMRNFIYEIGFTRITETTCENHDYKIGFTSQLCHVIACSLVDSARDEKITAFGGGSFEDLTRIAMINAPLWTELFISNKEKLVEHIENFESVVDSFKTAIKNEDSKKLTELMEESREKRLKMGSIRTKAE